MQLSEHFTLKEFTDSDKAKEHGIENIPDGYQISSIRFLVIEVLQPLRYILNKPVIITSGFRSQKLNQLVGGKKYSHHLCLDNYAAGDIVVPGIEPEKVQYEVMNNNLPVEECINEYDEWTHISIRKPSMQLIKAIRDKYGGSKYEVVSWV